MTDAELSAAVAVRVMGWRQDSLGNWHKRSKDGTAWVSLGSFGGMEHAKLSFPEDYGLIDTWDGMGMVVERMQEKGFRFGMRLDDYRPSHKVLAGFASLDTNWIDAEADTAPRAVALAALAAVRAGQS